MSDKTADLGAVELSWYEGNAAANDGLTQNIAKADLLSLIAEVRRRRSQPVAGMDLTESLAKFARWAIREGAWQGGGLDGGAIQEEAERLGLIVKVPYDPEAHGENDVGAEAGDDWFVFASALRTLFKGERMTMGPYTSDTHNELSRKFTMDILGEALKRHASPEDILVLVESCVMGAYLALVKLGGDEKVLDVMMAGIRRRLAERRLGGIQPAGKV